MNVGPLVVGAKPSLEWSVVVAEVMNATPQVLQNTLTGGVLGWGFTTTSQFSLLEILGYVSGCAFTILWGKETPKWGPLPRLGFKYTRLLTVGFACLLAYQVLMYFYVSPVLNLGAHLATASSLPR